MDDNKLWKILKEMGITDHLICLLRNLYAGQEATVRTGIPLAGNGKSLAGQAYMNICRRLNGEQVPFLDLDTKKGFFSKLFSK